MMPHKQTATSANVDLFNQPIPEVRPKQEATGEELRDDGMAQALDHAEEKHHNWGAHARYLLERFIVAYPHEFRTEQFLEWAYDNGLPTPPDDRSIGSVMRKAGGKDGCISKQGIVLAEKASSHKGYVTLWHPKYK